MKKNDKYSMSYQGGRMLVTPLFKNALKPTIIDSDNIPKDGPLILCGNHLHVWDQVPVICSTKRTIHWLAKKEYFDSKLSLMYKMMGCISVDREGNSSTSKNEALDYLNKGLAIGIFPEGTRNQYQVFKNKIEQLNIEYNEIVNNLNMKLIDASKAKEKLIELSNKKIELCNFMQEAKEKYKKKNIEINPDEELLPFHYGTVSMAQKTNATIVPFAVNGDYKVGNDNLIVRFGDPYKIISDDLTEENNRLRNKVLTLVKANKDDIRKR